MGKIFMKAVQQNMYNLNKSGVKSTGFVLRPERYSTIGEKQIVESCAENSLVPKAYVVATMEALSQSITNFLLNGHSVTFPNLGIFSLTSNGYAAGNVDEAGLEQLKKLKLHFLPCTDLKEKIENVDVELEGIYEIAGETVIAEATATTPAKTQKYYRRVTSSTASSSSSSSGTNTSAGSTDAGSTDTSSTDSGSTTTTTKKTLTLAASPTEGGTVTGGGSYDAGTQVDITATANSGFTFSKWDDDDTNASRTVTVNDDMSLTAIFTKNSSSDGSELDD